VKSEEEFLKFLVLFSSDQKTKSFLCKKENELTFPEIEGKAFDNEFRWEIETNPKSSNP